MPTSDENFRRMSPIELVKSDGNVIPYARGATTDLERATALLAAQTAAVNGDTVRAIKGNINLGTTQIGKSGVHFDINPRVRIYPSAVAAVWNIQGIWNGLGQLTWPYTYNLNRGLRRWFDSLGQATKTISGVSGGGVDVVCIGHSRTEYGYGSLAPSITVTDPAITVTVMQYLCDKWTHLLKVKLQDHYNPPDVQGGMGYVPVIRHANTTPSVANDYVWSVTGTVGDAAINYPSHRGSIMTGNAEQKILLQLDGSDANARFKRTNVSSFELSHYRFSGGGTMIVDVGNGSAPATGAGYVTGTVATAGGTLISNHSTTISGALNRTANNYFQVTMPAGGTEARLDGAFFYDGDRDCGIRLHNVAIWGTTIGSLVNTWASTTWAGVKRLFTATPGQLTGAFHGKLAICDHIGQDMVAGTTPAAFKTNYLKLVDELVASASKPCVLCLIPPMPDAYQDSYRQLYMDLIEMIYQVADERDHVAVLNLDSKMMHGMEDDGGLYAAYGWRSIGGYSNKDYKHDSCVGHRIVANELFRVLT